MRQVSDHAGSISHSCVCLILFLTLSLILSLSISLSFFLIRSSLSLTPSLIILLGGDSEYNIIVFDSVQNIFNHS